MDDIGVRTSFWSSPSTKAGICVFGCISIPALSFFGYRKFRAWRSLKGRLGKIADSTSYPPALQKALGSLPSDRRDSVIICAQGEAVASINELANRIYQQRPPSLRTWPDASRTAAWLDHIKTFSGDPTFKAGPLSMGTKGTDFFWLLKIQEVDRNNSLYSLARACQKSGGEKLWNAAEWREYLENFRLASDSPLAGQLREIGADFEALPELCQYASCRESYHELLQTVTPELKKPFTDPLSPYRHARPNWREPSWTQALDLEEFLDQLNCDIELGTRVDPDLDFSALAAANVRGANNYLWGELTDAERKLCEKILALYK